MNHIVQDENAVKIVTSTSKVVTNTRHCYQGRSDGGGYRYLYPPKSAQVNFLWGKMTSERLFDSFIHPQKLLYPPKQISAYAPECYCLITSNTNT